MSLLFLCLLFLLIVDVNIANEDDDINCDDIGKIKTVNWNTLPQDESEAPYVDVTMNVDLDTLTLHIKAEVEYVGYSIADRTEIYGYGTTYVLDFKSFDAHSSSISNPGLCSNRIASSFIDNDFNKWWTYSEYPYLPDQIGQVNNYLAYPKPSKYWNISLNIADDNSKCSNPIIYSGIFTINDLLLSCCDSNNIVIINDNNWINITGMFYINLVSPISSKYDLGYYYIYQLYSSRFIISIHKHLNILSSTGISIFTITFISIYKYDKENKYTLIILTESADYLDLNINKILLAPNNLIELFEYENEGLSENNQCLSVKNNICSQLFKLNVNNINCANDIFSGDYIIRFNIKCADDNNNDICNNWLEIHDNYIDLSLKLEWTDNICNAQVWEIHFNAKILFYIDDNWNDNSLQIVDGLYEIGIDRVYVSISLINTNMYDIMSIKLTNIWLCTVDDNDILTLNNNELSGGCFSKEIDSDGPYHIIQNGEIGIGYDNVNLYDNNDDEIRFSFIVPPTIVRSKLYVHAQISILLKQEGDKIIERRILISDNDNNNNVNQIRHYINYISLKNQKNNNFKHQSKKKKKDGTIWSPIWFIFIVLILIIAIIAIIFALFMAFKNYKFTGNTFSRYSMLRNIMSGSGMSSEDEIDNVDDINSENVSWLKEYIQDQANHDQSQSN